MSSLLRASLSSVIGGGTPSRAIAKYWKGSIPWASVKDFRDHTFDLDSTQEHISSEGLSASAAHLIPAGTPIVVTRMAVGRVGIFPFPVAINQDLKALAADSSIDPRFLAYFLLHIQPALEAISTGSTVKGISLPDLLNREVDFPPLDEQRRIAAILDASEATIRATDAVIEKMRLERGGVIRDLLARGITASGSMRLPPTVDASDHVSSPIGSIPRAWTIRTTKDLAVGGVMNGVFKEPSRVGRGCRLVNVSDLYRGECVDLNGCERFDSSVTEKQRYGVQRGDIFFTRSSLNLAGIAQTSFMADDPHDAVFECHVMRLRPNRTVVIPRFLKEWCLSPYARRHFMSHAKQVTMTTIAQDGIVSLLCPVPSLEEQQAAVAIMDGYDCEISTEQKKLAKLRLQHQGLLHDLLTGTVHSHA